MNKPILKVGFADYFNPIDEFFIEMLSHDFDVIRDDDNPRYLFFCDENFGQKNLSYDENKVIKIFYTGENRRPYNYRAHYAISFDHLDGQQFYRLPLYALENWVNQKKLGWKNLLDFKRTMRAKDKDGFCSFVVRNGGCQTRNEIFQLLSEYKRVDSGGPLFNNVGGPIDQNGFNSHVTKTDFIKKRKFHIAYENSSYPGYVTEKILHGFLGESIPIYWGSPCVEMDFNPKAFINRHSFRTTIDMIDFIKAVDQDDNLYNEIMSQPILSPYNRFLDFSDFRYWFREKVYKG
jgi:hypothetical protein